MRSPAKAIHSPLPLFATPTEALGGFNPTAPRIRCIESRMIRRNLRGCHAICCHWKSKSIAQQSAPTAGSQGKANHTPNGIAWQEKPFPGGPCGAGGGPEDALVRRGKSSQKLRRPLPGWKRPVQNGPSKASRIDSLAGAEPETPARICFGCIFFPGRTPHLACSLALGKAASTRERSAGDLGDAIQMPKSAQGDSLPIPSKTSISEPRHGWRIPENRRVFARHSKFQETKV